jgi:ABC-type lipoprotein export system ATPase subunit
MNIFKRLLYPINLNKIFTPNTVAELTYVNRSIIETDLEKYLSLPGKQIIVYGHSGSGKTTLLRNKLKDIKQNSIKTHCESTTTFNELLLHITLAEN